MNQLITATQLTMSSLEVSELTGKRHDNVMVDTEKLLNELGLNTPDFSGVYLAANNQEYMCFNLPKRECLILISGYSVALRAKIIDRWQELESQQAPKLPQSFAQALQLAADQAKVIEDQQAAIAIAAPKVEFVDRYVASTGNKGFRQVAKLLKAKEPELRSFLESSKIMYRLGNEWVAYQNHIDAGRFAVSTGTANEHAYNTARFTPKGVEWIAGLWAVNQLNNGWESWIL